MVVLGAPLNTPLASWGVVGNFGADVDVFEGGQAIRNLGHCRRIEGFKVDEWLNLGEVGVACPANATFDEAGKARIGPCSLVVSPCGVEDAALAVGAYPRPWFSVFAFGLLAFRTIFENDAVFFVVLGVNVGFIPAGEAAEALHDGVIGNCDLSGEDLTAVSLELTAHQANHFRIVAPAEGGAVEWDEGPTTGDKVEDGFGLSIFDAIDVGVQHQSVELPEHLSGEIFHAVGVLHPDTALFKDAGELMKAFGWAMVPIIAHEEEFKVSGGSFQRKQEQQNEEGDTDAGETRVGVQFRHRGFGRR